MFTPDLQSEFIQQSNMEANDDQPQQASVHPKKHWQITLDNIEQALQRKETRKAGLLLCVLEIQFLKAEQAAFNEGLRFNLPF